jgi:predicted aldo/keto reductase-like oxidoreductase
MVYRDIYKADVKVSAMGLGCMRLPQDGGRIDKPHALRMMHTAVERGVNYFDTAYMYHGGESELVVAEALKDIGRDKIYVATKMPCSNVEKKEDLERILDDQLKKLGVDTIDFYLFHAVSTGTWKKMLEFDALTFLDKAIEKGKIRFPGFSHHDGIANFKEVVDAYPKWVVCQIILNYMDDKYQAGLEGCLYAADKKVNTVVMEPLKGGMLTANIPDGVTSLFRAANPDITLSEWGLRWVYGVSQATCALSGVSNMAQLEENLASYEKFERLGYAELSDSEKTLYEDVKLVFLRHKGVSCTSCRYCMPCPSGVDIPEVFGNYNLIKTFNNSGSAKMRYSRMVYAGTSADNCTDCGRCEKLCPQKLPIASLMKEAHAAMT